jgi:adenylylsulfate kinase
VGSKGLIITRKRSLAKSLTWRILAIIVTFASIYLLTGEIDTATAGTILTNSVNFILYYFHERTWNSIGWGKENV